MPIDSAASGTTVPHAHLHVPEAGETASLLVDYRELFKLRVTLMVTLTGWAGFYLGSMRSGISSIQPGRIRLAIVSLVPSGWIRPWFSSKISR